MISYRLLVEIAAHKRKGRNINQTARQTGLSYPTVKKYWNVSPEEFEMLQEKESRRKKKSGCDQYREEIVGLLKEAPERSSANIYDRLLERHAPCFEISERALRAYIQRVRKEEDIPKREKPRDFQAVGSLEPGKQMQVDVRPVCR